MQWRPGRRRRVRQLVPVLSSRNESQSQKLEHLAGGFKRRGSRKGLSRSVPKRGLGLLEAVARFRVCQWRVLA